jgi:hypothetical protein
MRLAKWEWESSCRGIIQEFQEDAAPAHVLRQKLKSQVGEAVYQHYRLEKLTYFESLSDTDGKLIFEEVALVSGMLETLGAQRALFEFSAAEVGRVEQAIVSMLKQRDYQFLNYVERSYGSRASSNDEWAEWPLSFIKAYFD